MIDNHNLTVIAHDLVPIVPYSTQMVSIGMGQRYDIIVTATETSGNYWLRAIPQIFCSDNDNTDNIKGIVKYDAADTSEPTSSAYTDEDNCDDEAMTNLVPYVALNAAADEIEDDFAVTLGFVSTTLGNVVKWYMAGTTFEVDWATPTVQQVIDGADFTTNNHVIELDNANEWVYFIMETALAAPHPIHLHGHDFYVLAQGTGTYTDSTTINLTNPPRRDVAMLPAAGYLVIAFYTDNPGAWLMHCHIGWHTSEGRIISSLSSYRTLPPMPPLAQRHFLE
jgi:FtsP/CotA-like multicopper oxidase with cupredoxin domain